jgi:hypothetical protein
VAVAERGEYRAIRRVLLDGPDFQQLSERARWVFVALKLNMGPTGIEVHYRGALAHQVAAQTGVPAEAVTAAMDELEAGDWIRQEGNILWVVGQLDHDPHLKDNDQKHRKSVVKHVAGLPRLAIVRRFIEEHPQWFSDADPFDGLPEGPWKAHGSPSPVPKTEDRRPKTDNRDPPGVAHAREPIDPAVEDPEIVDDPPAVPGDTGARVVPLRPPGDLPFAGQDWDGRVSGSVVLQEWITLQPTPPSRRDRDRYGRTAKQLADEHTTGEIALAFVGMRYLWPFGDPKTGKAREPWTPEDLLRVFAKALPAARNHPRFKADEFRRDFNAAGGGLW